MSAFFIVAIISCLFIYLIIGERKKYKIIKSLPGPPMVPILGSLCFWCSTTIKFGELMMEMSLKYGKRCRMMIGSYLIVLLTDPEDVMEVLNKALNKSMFYDFFLPWLGNGILLSKGHVWKQNRKFLNAAYQFKILEGHLPIFDDGINSLIDKIKKSSAGGKAIDTYPIICEFTLEAIIATATGLKLDSNNQDNVDYVKSIKTLLLMINLRCTNVFLQFGLIFGLTKYGKSQRDALKVVDKFTKNVIRERRQALKDAGMKTSMVDDDPSIGLKAKMLFLDLMILSDRHFSDQEIKDELETAFFGGHDTTTSAISYTLYEISRNPHVAEKLLIEQHRIFGTDRHRMSTNAELMEMKYLEITIKEALRLHNIAPVISRRIDEDTNINGMILPKGTIAIVNLTSMSMNPEVFPNPEQFTPERFSLEESVDRHAYSFIPFSAGPRNCIGHKYAMMQMKSTVSKILRNFNLSNGGVKLDVTGDIVSKPKNGAFVKFEERENDGSI